MSVPTILNVALSIVLVLALVCSRRPLWLKSALVAMFLLVAGGWWGANRFTGNGFDLSVLYHMQVGVKGAGFAEYAVEILIVGLFALVVCAVLLMPVLRRKAGGWLPSLAFWGLYGLALCLAPGPRSIYLLLDEYGSFFGGDEAAQVAQEYRVPAGTLSRPRNLVYIYAESLERTYLDEERFPGLLPNIRRLSAEALDFTRIRQLPGSGWTIAGMVSSQCGVPLSMPVAQGNTLGGRSSFMSGATCLGDLLQAQGYQTAFYGGADPAFAGKHGFLTQHGFERIVGLDYFSALPGLAAEDMSAWGVKDDVLLEHAYDTYEEMSAAGMPFFLSLLTLDTHHPSGHISSSCVGLHYEHSELPMLQAVHCADRLLGDFVDRIRKSQWGANTVVVLASDHLAMVNDAQRLLQGNGERRKNLFLLFDPEQAPGRIETPGAVLDEGSTILDVLGMEEPALGFGRSLLRSPPVDGMSRAHIDHGLVNNYMAFARGLWGEASIENGVSLQGDKLLVDQELMDLPLLVSLEGEGRVREPYMNDPLAALLSLPADSYYLYVDRCELLQQSGDGYCMFYGRKGKWSVLFEHDELMAGVVPTRRDYVQRRESWSGEALSIDVLDQVQVVSGGFPHLSRVHYGLSQVVPSRGVTVYELDGQGSLLTMGNYDACGGSVNLSAVEGSGRYVLVVANDSAVCGERESLEALAARLGSQVMAGLQFRQPYVGVYDKESRSWVAELTADSGMSIHRFFSLDGLHLVKPCELLGRCLP